MLRDLNNIRRHNDVILAKVVDRAEERLPAVDLVLGDGEYQTAVRNHPRSRENLERQWRAESEDLEGKLSRYRMPLLTLNTEEAVSGQLRRLMGQRVPVKNR
jgi:hypothetical protein